MKKALMIVAIVALIAIVGSMVYYFIFLRTEKERAEISLQEQELEFEKEKQRTEKQQEFNNKTELINQLDDLRVWYNESMEKVYENYRENWYNECISRGLAPDGSLPKNKADELDDQYHKEIEYIDKLYQGLKDDLYKLYD